MFMKKLLIFVGVCIAAAVCGCVSGTVSPAAVDATGLMRVRVVDGMTDEPIRGAEVVLPEAGILCRTGADGMTGLMTVPCVPDERHASLCGTEDGRTTVIVYADGYVPYLLLYAMVEPGRERETPTAYMFPDDGSLPVFAVIEAPPMEWAAAVAERYRP